MIRFVEKETILLLKQFFKSPTTNKVIFCFSQRHFVFICIQILRKKPLQYNRKLWDNYRTIPFPLRADLYSNGDTPHTFDQTNIIKQIHLFPNYSRCLLTYLLLSQVDIFNVKILSRIYRFQNLSKGKNALQENF